VDFWWSKAIEITWAVEQCDFGGAKPIEIYMGGGAMWWVKPIEITWSGGAMWILVEHKAH
jgi:hypothetical protein